MWRIEDRPTSTAGTETFKCSIRTKIYDFQSPVEWKRLYFWTADIATALPVKAVAYPVALPEMALQLSWDQISKDYEAETGYKTWDELSYDNIDDTVFGTWDNLAKPSGAVSTLVDNFSPGAVLRLEAKLNQSLRFRRIYFELYLDCDGTALTSPVQVFSITPMIGAKAKIAKEAN
jgi:hypothetical protein